MRVQALSRKVRAGKTVLVSSRTSSGIPISEKAPALAMSKTRREFDGFTANPMTIRDVSNTALSLGLEPLELLQNPAWRGPLACLPNLSLKPCPCLLCRRDYSILFAQPDYSSPESFGLCAIVSLLNKLRKHACRDALQLDQDLGFGQRSSWIILYKENLNFVYTTLDQEETWLSR